MEEGKGIVREKKDQEIGRDRQGKEVQERALNLNILSRSVTQTP